MKKMAMSTNRIFKMTMTMRTLLSSSHCTTSVRLLQNSSVKFMSEKITSNILSPQPMGIKATSDIMKHRNQFKWCESKSQVFEIVNNSKSLSGVEAIRALEALFKFDKESGQHDESITNRKEFITLCELANKELRQLSEKYIIDLLKILMYFEIPMTSIIMQSLLQMIRQSMNTLSLEQISFVNFLLKQTHDKTPLVEALKIALPIVFQTHVTTKLDTENIESLTTALALLSETKYNNNDEAITLVFNALNKHSDFSTEQAMSILSSLYKLRNSNDNVELIGKVQNIIINNTDDIIPLRLMHVIKNISQKHKHKEDNFYNERLIEVIIQTIISKNSDVFIAIDLLKDLNRIKFASTSLLDYISAKCYEDQSVANTLTSKKVVNIISAMALADYKPIFYDSLKDLLLKDEILHLQFYYLINIALYLLSLDYYWPQLLSRIFEDKICSNRDLIQKISFRDQRRLLLLHHTVSAYHPEHSGPLLSDDIIQVIENKASLIELSSYPLKLALELSLGGPQYVRTHVETEFGYIIDHLVILRKGGYPIAIYDDNEKSPIKLSDLKLIPDSQVLFFLYIRRSDFIRNTQRLTGIQLLKVKLLKTKPNYTIIPVIADMWNSLSELEQTRYISQAIRLKSDQLSASINS